MNWSAFGVFPDPPNRATQPVTIRVNASRWGSAFSVWISDGYRTRFGSPGTWDTESGTYLTSYDYGTISSWDDQGVYNPLDVLTFTASIDPLKSWWVQDETSGEMFAIGQADILDGWSPTHDAPPTHGIITLKLPSWQDYAGFCLFTSDGSQIATFVWDGTMSRYDIAYPGWTGWTNT